MPATENGASRRDALQLLFRQQLPQHEWQNPAVPASVISSEVEKSLALFA
jgi:hypothetical protein